MKSAAWLILASMVTLGSSGCARGGTAPPASSAHGPERASVAVEYEVTRKGTDEGVVLKGRTNLDAPGDAEVKYDSRDDATPPGHGQRRREELRVGARERSDGTFDVELRYREQSPDGEIAWEPVLHLARGASSSVDVAGAGWSRTIRVKLE